MPALAENPFVRFLFLGFRAISKPSFLKKYSGLTKTSFVGMTGCGFLCGFEPVRVVWDWWFA
ncbi:hypothetical protein EZZ75_05710 [Neisseria meningitidis]|nr:hypothetical protein [Neisseria meningitidis]